MLPLSFLSFLFLSLTGTALGLSDGAVVPKTVLPTATGKKIEVTAYAKEQNKKNLLLVFFRTGNCGVCVKQLEEFAQNIDEIGKRNATILALSLDDAIVQTRVAERISNRYPILLDPDAKTVKKFGVLNSQENLAFPSVFLLGADNKILYSYVGKGMNDRLPLPKVLELLKHYSGGLPTRNNASQ